MIPAPPVKLERSSLKYGNHVGLILNETVVCKKKRNILSEKEITVIDFDKF